MHCSCVHSKANTLMRFAGIGKSRFAGNGGAELEASYEGSKAVGLAAKGNVYLADTESHSIRGLDLKKATTEFPVGNSK